MTNSKQNIHMFYSEIKPNILRVTITKEDAPPVQSHMIKKEIVEQPPTDTLEHFLAEEQEGGLHIAHEEEPLLTIRGYDLVAEDVIKYSTEGEKPQVEVIKTVDGERTVIKNLKEYTDREAYRGVLHLGLQEDEAIYGLGQDEQGVYNYRGHKRYLYQHNMMIPMPAMVSSAGYGILFDCTSLMIFDDTGEDTAITLDTVGQIDCYIIAGGMDEIVAGFRQLTGAATMLPKWAFGYVQSRERYKTGEELVDVGKKYRELGIPIDLIVQDWKTWGGEEWGQKTVDKSRFPHLKESIDALHDMNIHTMVSVWPNMAEGGANHREFADADLLLHDYSTYDAFSEQGREMYFKQANEELYSSGFDSWWCDSTEPFTSSDWQGERLLPEEERYKMVGGDHKKYLDPEEANFYAVVHARGMYENQRKLDPNKRMLNLTRSGYLGIQQYGAVLWAGDTSARWKELKGEIAKGLNMSISGIPYWTVDIGAFFTGSTECWRKWTGDPDAAPVWFWRGDYDEGVANNGYRELYTRWLQFGCFLPMFRSHGTDTPREIWNFGEEGDEFYDVIEKYIRLRYHLLPHIYSLAAHSALEDGTMMRSLLFDFAKDDAVKDLADQFMLGKELMICPVTEPMYYDKEGKAIEVEKTRKCYLPKGADWTNYWTGEGYTGGQWVSVRADIATIPIFVRAGSLLLTQKDVSHSMENNSEYTLTIYPGAAGQFVYYDDDGLSYDYQQGEYQKAVFFWSEAKRQLAINKLSSFDKVLRFTIVLGDRKKEIVLDQDEIILDF